MFDEYCSSLPPNNTDTQKALNEEQAALLGGYTEFKLDFNNEEQSELMPVDLTD